MGQSVKVNVFQGCPVFLFMPHKKSVLGNAIEKTERKGESH